MKIPGWDFKKRQANQKTHGWPQGHPTVQLPKYMGRTEEAIQEKPIQKSEKNGRNWKNDGSIQKSEKWEELKERRIKKLCAETDFSIDKIVSCHYTPLETLRVQLAKFKGGNITNCFERANITQDHFFLNIVKFDLTIEFAKVPVYQFV